MFLHTVTASETNAKVIIARKERSSKSGTDEGTEKSLLADSLFDRVALAVVMLIFDVAIVVSLLSM